MAQVLINDSTLSSLGDAIREKKGVEDTFTPSEMVEEVKNMDILPEEAFVISGNCRYRFAYDANKWLLKKYFDKLQCRDITDCQYMFYFSNSNDDIKFPDLYLIGNVAYLTSLYDGCHYLLKAPYINGKIASMSNLFQDCRRLNEIPEDWADKVDWSYIQEKGGNITNIFYSCYSLRHIPQNLIENIYSKTTQSAYNYAPYAYNYGGCYCLEELNNLPVQTGYGTNQNSAYTSNLFSSAFYSCSRLAHLTFKTNEDGSPIVAKWKSQTIDLSSYVGYVNYNSVGNITNYTSGITNATRITDAETYAALKDNPDSWTAEIDYSRYNHDSAVETINSLPDCSATGTNTIKFKGQSGALTDGGAINTLTADEIAVATAKGWTVSII